MADVFEPGVFDDGVFFGEGGSPVNAEIFFRLGGEWVPVTKRARIAGVWLPSGEPPETDFTLTETGDGAILANLPPLTPFDAVGETGDGAILTMEP